jgi:hypothetical protein
LAEFLLASVKMKTEGINQILQVYNNGATAEHYLNLQKKEEKKKRFY